MFRRDEPPVEPDRSQRVDNLQLPPLFSEEDELFMKWALEMEEELERFIHLLRNEERDKDSGEWVARKIGKPLLSEEGIYRTVMVLKGYVNKNVFLSNLSEEFINDLIREDISDRFWFLYARHFYSWALQEPPSLLAAMARDITAFSLFRAMGFRTANLVKTTRFVEERRSTPNAQPKKGLLGGLL